MSQLPGSAMIRYITIVFAVLFAPFAMAQENRGTVNTPSAINETPAPDVIVGLGVSTLGANLEAAYRMNPTYQVRGVVMGGIDIDYDETSDDGEFNGNLTLGGVALMGDFYPLQTGWRVSGGLLFSGSELTATGTADVEGAMNVDADIEARFASEIAPMITTGYDVAMGERWSLNTEAGLIFIGGIDLTYTASDPTLQDELDNDPDLRETVEDASDIPIYPYASITVSFRF